MARTRSRYGKLIREYRHAGGVAGGEGRLFYFDQWLKGLRHVTIENQIPDGGRKLFPVPIYAFGIDYQAASSAAAVVAATASAYSLSGLARLGGSTNILLGHNLPPEDKEVARIESGFYPALVKVKMTAAGSVPNANKRGALTNEQYTYHYGRTFGLPFGRPVATPEDDYVERMAAVSDDLRAKPGVRSVNFAAEIWRRKTTAGEFNPTTDNVAVT